MPSGQAETEEGLASRLRDCSAPRWAKEARNCRGLMQWDSSQFVCLARMGESLVEGILDTGAACTIMDIDMAKRIGLPVVEEARAEFGSFTVPGRSQPIPYPGAVLGPVSIQFSQEVSVEIPLLRLLRHGRPLLLIGADILAGSPKVGQWEFGGMGPQKLS